MHRQRHFLLLVTLAAAAATPALGQTSVPAAGPPETGSKGPASIPDFSGIWGRPYLGFEPPLSGPGPVVNKSRRRQVSDVDNRPLPAANAPLVNSNLQAVGDYLNSILKPHAAQVVKEHGEIELNGLNSPTPFNQCWPQPVPYIFLNFGMQMLQHPDRITILHNGDVDHEVRHVRMNQPHLTPVTPSWYGDSVGHYEGDTLVIDTIGIKTDRPFAMVDLFGTPYTEALHVVERYRLIEYERAREAQERGGRQLWRIPGEAFGWAPAVNYRGKGLQLEFAVEDQGVFTTPWSATVTYRRPLITEWPEIDCAENPRAAVPHADRPDF
jgi:hypothetical protein